VGGVREVRATNGNTHLGGDDFDERLVGIFLEHLGKQGARPAGDARAMARLRRLAEATQVALSADPSTRVSEQFVSTDEAGRPCTGADGHPARAGGAHRGAAGVHRRPQPEGARRRRLEGQKLSRVCLVGGSTRIPMVRRLLAEAFDADIHEEIDPDLAVGRARRCRRGCSPGRPSSASW
jgi:molecular chaperone DnaK